MATNYPVAFYFANLTSPKAPLPNYEVFYLGTLTN